MRDHPMHHSETETQILSPIDLLKTAGCDHRQIDAMTEIDSHCHINNVTVSTLASFRWSRIHGGRIIQPRRIIRFSAILPD